MSNLLWTIAAILIILWLIGYNVGRFGSLLHILLVLAVIAIIYNLATGRRR